MPRFRYQAVTADGNQTTGVIESADAQEAIKQLAEAGWEVLSIELTIDAGEAETPMKPEPLTRGERLELTEHLADMIEAELPLVEGFTALAEELPAGRLQRSMKRLARLLERGVSLEMALRDEQLPGEFIAVVRAGLESGEPALVLSQYVAHARRSDDLRRRLALGVGYPLVLVLCSTFVAIFLVGYLVPQFREIFEDFGVELPRLTNLLMATSTFLQRFGGIILIVLVVLGVVLLLVWKRGLSQEQKSRIQSRLPVLGKMYRAARLARLYRLLSILLENKLPLPEALRLAGDGCGDAELQRELQLLAISVERGENVTAVRGLKLPPALIEMMFSREAQQDSNTATEMYVAMAELFEHRADARAQRIAAISEPAIILVTGSAIGGLVISLFLPLIRLLNDLS